MCQSLSSKGSNPFDKESWAAGHQVVAMTTHIYMRGMVCYPGNRLLDGLQVKERVPDLYRNVGAVTRGCGQ